MEIKFSKKQLIEDTNKVLEANNYSYLINDLKFVERFGGHVDYVEIHYYIWSWESFTIPASVLAHWIKSKKFGERLAAPLLNIYKKYNLNGRFVNMY